VSHTGAPFDGIAVVVKGNPKVRLLPTVLLCASGARTSSRFAQTANTPFLAREADFARCFRKRFERGYADTSAKVFLQVHVSSTGLVTDVLSMGPSDDEAARCMAKAVVGVRVDAQGCLDGREDLVFETQCECEAPMAGASRTSGAAALRCGVVSCR